MQKLKLRFAPVSLSLLLLAGCATQPLTEAIPPAPVANSINNTDDFAPSIALPSLQAPDPQDSDESSDAVMVPSIWAQFRRHTLLDLTTDNARIDVERRFYQNNPEYMERVLTRAEPYLYYVQSEIQRRGLPSELLLLPIVESAYDPFAYSHGRAAGLWQFIPGTGKRFGLKQTWWYEGRRDIVASTNAALNYLDALQKQFDGDWLLALAAYNAGEGNIAKAVAANKRHGKPTDFWSLNLRAETSAYVPRLIAVSQIFNDPSKYNVTLREVPFEPYFTPVDIRSQLDLAQAAGMAGIPIEELYKLNPAFNRWATDPAGPHRLLVPVAQAQQFQLELDNMPPAQRVRWDRYTIRKGDTVSTISRKFHITPELLKSVNGMASNNLREGKTLLIPQSTQPLQQYALSADQRLQAKLSKNTTSSSIQHSVRAGETLWSISRKYKVDMMQLASWNGMAPKDPLTKGRKLTIKTNTTTIAKVTSPMQAKRMRKIKYRARSGDSYAGIASKFKVSLNEIKQWNNVNMRKYLQPGDMLTLYVDVANAP